MSFSFRLGFPEWTALGSHGPLLFYTLRLVLDGDEDSDIRLKTEEIIAREKTTAINELTQNKGHTRLGIKVENKDDSKQGFDKEGLDSACKVELELGVNSCP